MKRSRNGWLLPKNAKKGTNCLKKANGNSFSDFDFEVVQVVACKLRRIQPVKVRLVKPKNHSKFNISFIRQFR